MSDIIRISFTGDFVPNQETLAMVNDNRIDEFSPDLKKLFADSDLVVTNVETPLTLNNDPILKTGYNFAAHPDNAKLIRNLGVGVACLANNHILDQNEQGVLDTIEVCNKCGIKTVGAGRNLKEAQKPLILEVKGKKIGLINFCEHEFSIAQEHKAGANPFDLIDNYRQITALREEVDVVIVVFHGSLEYHHLPMPHYKKACEFFVDAGADAVVGHHPHYYGGYSYYKGRPIFYSLGNFFARSRRKDDRQEYSYILELIINNNLKFNITPILINANLPYVELSKSFDRNVIEDINNTINDPFLLDNYWKDIAYNEKKKMLLRMFSLNRFFYRIIKRVPFEMRLTRFQELIIRNYLDCESHNSLLKYITEDLYKRRNKRTKK